MLFFFVIFFSCEFLMNPIHSSTPDLIVLSSMSSITRCIELINIFFVFLFAIQKKEKSIVIQNWIIVAIRKNNHKTECQTMLEKTKNPKNIYYIFIDFPKLKKPIHNKIFEGP